MTACAVHEFVKRVAAIWILALLVLVTLYFTMLLTYGCVTLWRALVNL